MRRIGEHFVTCGQMKLLEQRADAAGLSYYQMMENAGTGAAQFIMELAAYQDADKEDAGKARKAQGAGFQAAEENIAGAFVAESGSCGHADALYGKTAGNIASNSDVAKLVKAPLAKVSAGKAYIFCGKGNNGGDGFVVARLMSDAGYDITVILVEGSPKTADAITNFELLKKRPVRILNMDSNNRALMELDGIPDIIVDAMYGTGFRGRLESNGLKAAIYINRYARKDIDGKPATPVIVVSLDIPSGLGGDLVEEKELDENAITAHHTITFHAKKPVHLQKFALKYCGETAVVDIGIDEDRLWNIAF